MTARIFSPPLALLCPLLLPAFAPAGEKNPEAFAVAAVLEHEMALDRPHDIELSGKLAFVPGKGGSLAVVDVADPGEPKLLWHRHDPEALEEAETVLLNGDRLFLGTHDFHSIDVSDPRAPVFEARISDPERISHINGMACRDELVFAACKHGWLDAFDVSAPGEPELSAAANLRECWDLGNPHDVDLHGAFAVVVDPRGFGDRPGRVALVRVFDGKNGRLLPASGWELAGSVSSPELAGANRVQVSGNHAFVGASTSAGGGYLAVIDLGDPASPRQIASVPFAPDDAWGPNGLTVAGNVVFLAGGQSVEAIDVSDPARPVKLASRRFPEALANAHPRYEGGGDSGHDLICRDGHLYVTGQNDHCLLILRMDSDEVRARSGGEI